MNRPALGILLSMVLLSSACGQTTSPLHYYMNAHSIIAEPEVIQTLQSDIQQTYGNVKPGVRIQAFDDELLALKSQLYRFLAPPHFALSTTSSAECLNVPKYIETAKLKTIKYDASKSMIWTDSLNIDKDLSLIDADIKGHGTDTSDALQFRRSLAALSLRVSQAPYLYFKTENGTNDTIYIGEVVNLDSLMGRINLKLAAILEVELRRAATRAGMSDKVLKSLVASAIEGLEKANLFPPSTLGADSSKYVTVFCQNVTMLLMKNAVTLLTTKYPQMDFLAKLQESTIVVAIDSLVQRFNNLSVLASNSLQEQLEGAINQAQDKIESVLDEYTANVFGAAAGFAVTKGEGSFAGGLFYSLKLFDNLQGGAYFNGGLNQADTATAPVTLFGVQAQWAPWSSIQLEFMLCHLFMKGDVASWATTEAGGGLSFRWKQVIVGAEGYYFQDMAAHGDYVVGISLTGTNSGSPSVLLGVSVVNDKLKPILQAGIPILGK